MELILKQNESKFEQIHQFCSDLFNLVKSLEMYTETHAITMDYLHRCTLSAQTLIGSNPDYVITLDNDGLIFDIFRIADPIYTTKPIFSRIQTLFSDKNLATVTLMQSITEEDILALAIGLKAPSVNDVIELNVSQFLESEDITAIQVTMNNDNESNIPEESILLDHFFNGIFMTSINSELQESLYLEFIKTARSAGHQMLEFIRKEEGANYPINHRDLLSSQGEKWFHLLGDSIIKIFGKDALESDNIRVVNVLNELLPTISKMPISIKGTRVETFLSELSNANNTDKIKLLNQFLKNQSEELEQKREFLEKCIFFDENLIEKNLTGDGKNTEFMTDLLHFMPQTLIYPTINEKLFSAMERLRDRAFMLSVIDATMDAYIALENPSSTITSIFENRLINACDNHDEGCYHLTFKIIQKILDAQSDLVIERLGSRLHQMVGKNCNTCPCIDHCTVIDYIVGKIDIKSQSLKCLEFLFGIWREAAYSLLLCSPDEFKKQIAPLSQGKLNPERFENRQIQNMLNASWKSFAETSYFQDMYRNLVDNDREVRFRTIKSLSEFGPFVSWICLRGLDNQNWYLRRNLATVLGETISLNQTDILRTPLKDPDYHVRLAIITALHNRIADVSAVLKQNPIHPLLKIIFMALRDGNPMIRQQTYKIISTLKLTAAVRSLKELYQRLSMVNTENEINERIQILKILSELGNAPDAPVDEIVSFIAEVAAMKEGLITPNWMPAIKKASVQALSDIHHPSSRTWLNTLANEKPYKRSLAGKEARALLAKT